MVGYARLHDDMYDDEVEEGWCNILTPRQFRRDINTLGLSKWDRSITVGYRSRAGNNSWLLYHPRLRTRVTSGILIHSAYTLQYYIETRTKDLHTNVRTHSQHNKEQESAMQGKGGP